jgi:hypothetical protein
LFLAALSSLGWAAAHEAAMDHSSLCVASIAAICLPPWPIQLVRYLTPLCPFFLAFFTSILLESVFAKRHPEQREPSVLL